MTRKYLLPLVLGLATASCQIISGLSSVDVSETGGASSSQTSTATTTTATATATTTTTTDGAGGAGARCLDYCDEIESKCKGAELQFPNSDVCGAFCAFLDAPRLDCRVASLEQNLANACARAGPAGYLCDDPCSFCQDDTTYFCGDVQSGCDECATTDFSTFSWNGCADGSSRPAHCAVANIALLMTYGDNPTGIYCDPLHGGICPAASLCDGPP